MSAGYRVRVATPADVETIVSFTVRQAREAEQVELDVTSTRRGVGAAFGHTPPSRYWVAEDHNGHVVASTSIVTEWSDFHGGDYWWVQSVFIEQEHRGTGLLSLLLDRLADEATLANAIELRLYAHRDNSRALRAYGRAGFIEAPYVIMKRELPRRDETSRR